MSTDPQSPQKSIQERMAELAAEFVQNGKSAGVSLDYLPRTLLIAEKFVKGAPAETERMAAYLGPIPVYVILIGTRAALKGAAAALAGRTGRI